MPSEDEWQAAQDAIFGSSEPDPRPLARLIGRATNIPSGVRDMLAQMLDTDGDGYLRFRFVLQCDDNNRDSQYKDFMEIMPVAIEYFSLLKSGMKADEAKENLKKKFNISERTVGNYVARWKDIQGWLSGG